MFEDEDFDDFSLDSEENMDSEDYFVKGGFIEDAKELSQKYISKILQNKCCLISGDPINLRVVNSDDNISLVMNSSMEDSVELAHSAMNKSFLKQGKFLDLIHVFRIKDQEELEIQLKTNRDYCVRTSGENRIYLTLLTHPENKNMANIDEYSDAPFESRLIIAILQMLSIERVPKEFAGGLMLLYLQYCLGVSN